MIEIKDNIELLKAKLDPQFLLKAEKSAVKAVQGQTATQVSRKVRQIYNVTARAISARLKIGLTNNDRSAYLRWIGTRIGLINFSGQFKRVSTPAGKRQGATAKIRKDGSKFLTAGGFIAQGKNGNVHIFQRQNLGQDGRMPIQAKTGPSIPQMIEQPEVYEDAERFVEAKYPEILINRLQYFLDQQGKK